MKKFLLFIYIFLFTSLNGAIITGNQEKTSVIGGSIEVSSGGKSVIVNSGEITFYKQGSSPTNPRRIQKGDLDDIESELSGGDFSSMINIFYPPLNAFVVNSIKKVLIKNKIDPMNIKVSTSKNKLLLKVIKIDIESIKNVYPRYYKQLIRYLNKRKKAKYVGRKVPTLKLRRKDIRRYHKKTCKQFGC